MLRRKIWLINQAKHQNRRPFGILSCEKETPNKRILILEPPRNSRIPLSRPNPERDANAMEDDYSALPQTLTFMVWIGLPGLWILTLGSLSYTDNYRSSCMDPSKILHLWCIKRRTRNQQL
ncbi:hypothetical protein TWF718_007736 [Orbilia javanica]|uniref:Uncharacterized protein n=1 Tax=Orbilia javanica TaxID=47235 RepID=A0AAN8MRM7_9PEZI